MSDEVFLDTAYAIALASPGDLFHPQAAALADQLEMTHRRLITTQAVLPEIGNALSKPRYRMAAVRLLEALAADPNVEIIPCSEALHARSATVQGTRRQGLGAHRLHFVHRDARPRNRRSTHHGRAFSAGRFSRTDARTPVSAVQG